MDDLLITNNFENKQSNININDSNFNSFIESRDKYEKSYSNTTIDPLESQGSLNNPNNPKESNYQIKKTVITIDSKNRLRNTKLRSELVYFKYNNKTTNFLPDNPFESFDNSILVKVYAPKHGFIINTEIYFKGISADLSETGIFKNYLEYNDTEIKPIFTVKKIYDADYFFIEISGTSIIGGFAIYNINNKNIHSSTFGGKLVTVNKVLQKISGYYTSNHYNVDLPRKFSNVVKVKLVSIELPNTGYTINSTRKTSTFGSFNNLTTKINSNLNWINEEDYVETYNAQVYTDKIYDNTVNSNIINNSIDNNYQIEYSQKVFNNILNNNSLKMEYSKISSKEPNGDDGYGDYRNKDFYSPRYLITDSSSKNISDNNLVNTKYWLSNMYHNVQSTLITEISNQLNIDSDELFLKSLLQLKKNSLFLYNYYIKLIQKSDTYSKENQKNIGINLQNDSIEIPTYQGITVVDNFKNQGVISGLTTDEYITTSNIDSVYIYPYTFDKSEKFVEPVLLPDKYMNELNFEYNKFCIQRQKRYPIYNLILNDGKYNQLLFTNMLQNSLENVLGKVFDRQSMSFINNNSYISKHFGNETINNSTFKIHMDPNSSYIDIKQYKILDTYSDDNDRPNLLYYNRDIPYIFIESFGSVFKTGDVVRLDGFSKSDNITANILNKEHICSIFDTYSINVRLIHPLPDNVYMDQSNFFNNNIGNNLTSVDTASLNSLKRDLRKFLIPEDNSDNNYYNLPDYNYENIGNRDNIFGNSNNANKESYPISYIQGKILNNQSVLNLEPKIRYYNQFEKDSAFHFGIYNNVNDIYNDSFRNLYARSSKSFWEGSLISKLDNNQKQISRADQTFQTNLNYLGSKLVNSVNNQTVVTELYTSFNTNSFKTKIPVLSLRKYELILKISDIESTDSTITIGRIMEIKDELSSSGNYIINYDLINSNNDNNFNPGDIIIGLESKCVVCIVPETWNYDGIPNNVIINNGLGSYILEKYRNIEPIRSLIQRYKQTYNISGEQNTRYNDILKFKNTFNNWKPKKIVGTNYGFYININHFPNKTRLEGIKTKSARVLKPIKYKFLFEINNSPAEILNFPNNQEFDYIQSNYIDTNCSNILSSYYSEILHNTLGNYVILELNDKHDLEINDLIYIKNHKIKSNDRYQKILRIKSCEPFRNYMTYLNKKYINSGFSNINTIYDYHNNTPLYNIGLDSIANAYSYSFNPSINRIKVFGYFNISTSLKQDNLTYIIESNIFNSSNSGIVYKTVSLANDVIINDTETLLEGTHIGSILKIQKIYNKGLVGNETVINNYYYILEITDLENDNSIENRFGNFKKLIDNDGTFVVKLDGDQINVGGQHITLTFTIQYHNYKNCYNLYNKFNSNINTKQLGFREKTVKWFFDNPYIWNGNHIEKVLEFKNKYIEKNRLATSMYEMDLVAFKTNRLKNITNYQYANKILSQTNLVENYGKINWHEISPIHTLQSTSNLNRISIQTISDSDKFIKGKSLKIKIGTEYETLPAPIRLINNSKKSVIAKLTLAPVDSNGNNFTNNNNYTITIIPNDLSNHNLKKYTKNIIKIGTLIYQVNDNKKIYAKIKETINLEITDKIKVTILDSNNTLKIGGTCPLFFKFLDTHHIINLDNKPTTKKYFFHDGGKPYKGVDIQFATHIIAIDHDYSQQATPIHISENSNKLKTYLQEGPYIYNNDGDELQVDRNSSTIYPFLKGMGVYYYDQKDCSIYDIKPKLLGYVIDTSINDIKDYIDNYSVKDYTVDNNYVACINILHGGKGYSLETIVNILNDPEDLNGLGAKARVSKINDEGSILEIYIISGGKSYIREPLIQFETTQNQETAYAVAIIQKLVPTYTIYIDINQDSDLYSDWNEHFFPTSNNWEADPNWGNLVNPTSDNLVNDNEFFPGLLQMSEIYNKTGTLFLNDSTHSIREDIQTELNELTVSPTTDGYGFGCSLLIEMEPQTNSAIKNISKITIVKPGMGYKGADKLIINKDILLTNNDIIIPIIDENIQHNYNNTYPIYIYGKDSELSDNINTIHLPKHNREINELFSSRDEYNTIKKNKTDQELTAYIEEISRNFETNDYYNSPSFLYPYDQFYLFGTEHNNYSSDINKIFTVKSNIDGIITVFKSTEIIGDTYEYGIDLKTEIIEDKGFPEFCIIKGRGAYDHDGFYNLDKILSGTNIYFNNANLMDQANINTEVNTDSQIKTADYEKNFNQSINMKSPTIYNDSKTINNNYLRNRQAIATIVQGTLYDDHTKKYFIISGAYDHFYKTNLQNKCILNYKQKLSKPENNFIDNHQIIRKHPKLIINQNNHINDYNKRNVVDIPLADNSEYLTNIIDREDIHNPDIISLHPFEINDSILIFNHQNESYQYNKSSKESIVDLTNTKLKETNYSNEFNVAYDKETVGINNSSYNVMCNLWNGDINNTFIDDIYRPGQSVLIDKDFDEDVEKGFMNKGFMKVNGIITDIVHNNSTKYNKTIEEDLSLYNKYTIIPPNTKYKVVDPNKAKLYISSTDTNDSGHLGFGDIITPIEMYGTWAKIELDMGDPKLVRYTNISQKNVFEQIPLNPIRNDLTIYIKTTLGECKLSPLDVIIINPNIYGNLDKTPKQNSSNKYSEMCIVSDINAYSTNDGSEITQLNLISKLVNKHELNSDIISICKYAELFDDINIDNPYIVHIKKQIGTVSTPTNNNYINIGDTICFDWSIERYINLDADKAIPYEISDKINGTNISTQQFNIIRSLEDNGSHYSVTFFNKPIILYPKGTSLLIFNNSQSISTQPFTINNKWFTKIYYRGKHTLNILDNDDGTDLCKCYNVLTSKNIFVENMKGYSIPHMPVPSSSNNNNNDILNTINSSEPYIIDQVSPVQDAQYIIKPSIHEDFYNHVNKNINNLKFNGKFIESSYYLQNYHTDYSIDEITKYYNPNQIQFYWNTTQNDSYKDYDFIIIEGIHMGYGGKIKEKDSYDHNLINNQNGYKVLDTFIEDNRYFVTMDLKSEDLGFKNTINDYTQKIKPNTFNKSTILNNINTTLFDKINTIGTGGQLCMKQINVPFNLNITDYIYMCIPTLSHINTNTDNTIFSSCIFSKILLPNTNATTIYNSHISGVKEFNKHEIIDIDNLEIAYLTPDGHLFDFNGLDHSFTIEIHELVRSF